VRWNQLENGFFSGVAGYSSKSTSDMSTSDMSANRSSSFLAEVGVPASAVAYNGRSAAWCYFKLEDGGALPWAAWTCPTTPASSRLQAPARFAQLMSNPRRSRKPGKRSPEPTRWLWVIEPDRGNVGRFLFGWRPCAL